MSKLLRVAGVLIVVLVALAFLAMWGLSEDGLEEHRSEQAAEKAAEAGVSTACYAAITDSLMVANGALRLGTGEFSPLEEPIPHEDVVRMTQDAQMMRELCPTES